MHGVRGIDHVNLRAPAAIVERLRRFYVDIVGLTEGPRPSFRSGSHGYWLYAGDAAVVHLSIDVENRVVSRDTGGFNHIAFACENLEAARARLDAAGMAYTTSVIDETQQVQLFLKDPAGIGIELNFAMA